MQLRLTALHHGSMAAEPRSTSARRGGNAVDRPTTTELATAAAMFVMASALALPCGPFIIMAVSTDADSWLNSLWVFDAVPTVWGLAALGGFVCGARLKRRDPTRYARVIAETALAWAVLSLFASPWVISLWVSVHQMG